ncbi:MAG: PIN domain protein [Candidatus Curtissbacteria bacterium GW2011_GWA1_40_16]|uniref:PIN domain protein n=1 Tax=Candidatus Curtissbacteria bacterium GW2011_GWA1_40_16 TaxID=1618405 RepID=A0A0G0R5S0_9BACT|nr:MAG: PIN domain protein [Candidatus Curtissbacteria bacterium GW2011_GWA1_40_16]
MKKVLLDTSVIIDFLRRKDKEKSLFAHLLQEGNQTAVSIITHCELYAGKSVWEEKDAKEELEAGQIRAKSDLNLLDAIIAATAKIYNLELATLNLKDFKKVEELHLFKL